MKLKKIKTSKSGLEAVVHEMYSVEITADDIETTIVSDAVMAALGKIESNPALNSLTREEFADLVRASLAK